MVFQTGLHVNIKIIFNTTCNVMLKPKDCSIQKINKLKIITLFKFEFSGVFPPEITEIT